MKFQKLSAFEKHFREALSHHLSAIYVIVCPSESERKKILSSLAGHLKKRSDFLRAAQIDYALEHLNSGSLFSGTTSALYDGVDQLLKGEMERLSDYCRSPNTESCLLLGSARIKEVTQLYQACKTDMVVIDLSKEKPWDEKERFLQWVIQTARLSKKQIRPDAAADLLDRFPRDRLLLQQEIDKLLCYVGERQEVTIGDVKAVCGSSVEQSPYQLAKAIVWEGKATPPISADAAFVIPLITAVRAQLEIGLKLCALQKKGAAKGDIERAFPRLFPKALQQCMHGAIQQGSHFFKKGLCALFDFELGVKSSRGRLDVLYALFVHTLHSSSRDSRT